MLRARLFTFAALLAAGSLFSSAAAAAADPLGLTLDGGAGEQLGLGTDRIAVWICIPSPASVADFTPAQVADWANDEITPFFALVSRGQYTPVFEAADTFIRSSNCLNEAIDLTTDTRFTNTMVVDGSSTGGLGGPGFWLPIDGEVLPVAAESPPSVSGRGFSVGRATVGLPATAAHEIGHTLAWPHSGSSATGSAQYDNVADLMSGHGVDNFCPDVDDGQWPPCEITHTVAFNRYTSGWIDPDDISLVTKPIASVDLAGPEAGGRQFALVPSSDPLVFSTVEARPPRGYDAAAGFEGVVLHTIDQAAACGLRVETLCWGLNRPQYPAVGAPGSTDHILGVGESAVLHGVTVTVEAATGDGYSVSFRGAPQGCAMGPNPFGDVSSASFAFNDIGCIRLLGITTGTTPTTYSPLEAVTREQMAAFLARLHRGLGGTCSGDATPFVDIAGSFAAADIACIYALGVTTGVSSDRYDPKGIVTREQMAAFLGRLWRDARGGSCSGDSTPFTDIGASFARADVACIFALGITTGTSPTTYSPRDAVTREQMAAFLARFWKRA